MRKNDRLRVALHVLLHMSERPEQPMTSEEMAGCVGTNPVVIRRTFAGLREAGIVTSVKGHGGGWRLARPPEAVSVGEIQRALGEQILSLTSAEEKPQCLVLRSVIHALDEAMQEAERVLEQRLSKLSLADLAADVQKMAPGSRRHAV